MKTKRTLLSIITLCAALSLTACNGSGASTTENSQKVRTESTTEAVDNSNTKLDDLYQQENQIFADHADE
jgi:ABC-type oligopeptide transport system substrate-binding subunit